MSGIRADHFTIHEWLGLVNDAVAQLPEFQRDVVWKPDRVAKFLEAILHDRPVGCLLVLKVKGEVPFDPRPIEGAQPTSDKPIEYMILDGQQRITALWKTLMESDEDRRYFLRYFEHHKKGTLAGDDVEIRQMIRRQWQDDPKKCLERGVVPVSLLRHTQEPEERLHVSDWIDEALVDDEGKGSLKKRRDLEGWIWKHSEQLRNFVIPHLPMAYSTAPSQAISTFIESNTSSAKLKKFDIVVAEMLAREDHNLREAREKAWNNIPGLSRYIDLPTAGELILKVACLRSGFDPVESNYRREDVLDDVAYGLEEILAGIGWVVELLESDRIWDSRRLPSVVPFRVLPALHRYLPEKRSARGAMRKTARAYLWRAFLTDRYRSSAASLLKSDYDGLRKVVQEGGKPKKEVPIWEYELPTETEVRASAWPTKSSIPRALLAVSIRRGSRDLGSSDEIRMHDLKEREYHHLFPKAYLARKAASEEPNLAMNCVLIRGRTNREASGKPPLDYLRSLVVEQSGSRVSNRDLADRLSSHLVDMDSMKIGGRSVRKVYKAFVAQRARDVLADAKVLVEGSDP